MCDIPSRYSLGKNSKFPAYSMQMLGCDDDDDSKYAACGVLDGRWECLGKVLSPWSFFNPTTLAMYEQVERRIIESI